MASSSTEKSFLSAEASNADSSSLDAGRNGRLTFPGRIDQPEWLDLGYGTHADVERNLREMHVLNRLTGGVSALTAHLAPRVRGTAAPVQILDLGTGLGGAPLQLVRWAARQSVDLHVWAVDWSYRNLSCAADFLPGDLPVHLVCGDAHRLPFPAGSVDFVVSSLFLHHFSPEPLVRLLQSAYACARRGLIMTDLVRGAAPRAAFHLIAPLLARHPFTRHDGELSIRRAYRPGELLAVAQYAGLPDPRVQPHFPWRMTLVSDK